MFRVSFWSLPFLDLSQLSNLRLPFLDVSLYVEVHTRLNLPPVVKSNAHSFTSCLAIVWVFQGPLGISNGKVSDFFDLISSIFD